jgi:hypothetical protein
VAPVLYRSGVRDTFNRKASGYSASKPWSVAPIASSTTTAAKSQPRTPAAIHPSTCIAIVVLAQHQTNAVN